MSILITKYFQSFLVGGFNPFEKYISPNGNLLQVRVKMNKYLKPPSSFVFSVMLKHLKHSEKAGLQTSQNMHR